LHYYSQYPSYGINLGAQQWIKKLWYGFTMRYNSSIKKNETIICRKMNGTGYLHVKQNKPGLERQIACSFSYVDSRPKNKK
jgi:hypothetical protein